MKYEDVNSNSDIYEGEITNKKKKISNNHYMCYYEKVTYSENEINDFRELKNNRLFLEINTIILIFIIFVYSIKRIRNIITKNLIIK